VEEAKGHRAGSGAVPAWSIYPKRACDSRPSNVPLTESYALSSMMLFLSCSFFTTVTEGHLLETATCAAVDRSRGSMSRVRDAAATESHRSVIPPYSGQL